MSKIILKVTKASAEAPWVSTGRDSVRNFFTDNEISEVVMPYIQLVNNLPGLLEKRVVEEASTSMTLEYLFDTLTNATNASEVLFGSNPTPVVAAFKALMSEKVLSNGQSYTYTVE